MCEVLEGENRREKSCNDDLKSVLNILKIRVERKRDTETA